MAPLLTRLGQAFGFGAPTASEEAGGPSGITATGGLVSDYTDGGQVYRSHVFTTSGAFAITAANPDATIDLLVIGGGGGGSGSLPQYWAGCGGGAGGMLEIESYPVTNGVTYPVTIGAGGGGANREPNNGQGRGYTGDDTTFSNPPATPVNAVAKGGGGGGCSGPTAPGTDIRDGTGGGSCGGTGTAPSLSPVSPPAVVTSPLNPAISALSGVTLNHYGNVGGDGYADASGEGSGGGGAGSAGTGVTAPHSATHDNSGGDGRTNAWATGSNITYAAGGGAGPTKGAGIMGLPGTGNGGGGGANPGNGEAGGDGGDGTVVVRYTVASPAGTAKATGGFISYNGTQVIHVFTGSGTFTNTSGSPLPIAHVTIAGGGGGGGHNTGGGGGAGGFCTNLPALVNSPPLGTFSIPDVGPGSPNALTITIGAGGSGGKNYPTNGITPGDKGSNSSIVGPGPINVTAIGGGYGGKGVTSAPNAEAGGPGGSGGGGGGDDQAGPYGAGSGTTSPAVMGYNGGTGCSPGANGGGGGGGGSVGQAGSCPGNGGAGGNARQLPTIFSDENIGTNGPGTPATGTGWVVGGGGAGANVTAGGGGGGPVPAPYGGGGAGGQGSSGPGQIATDGKANTGGGGGGSAGFGTTNPGGTGGSGIVVIYYTE